MGIALVTAGTGGIGLAIARALAGDGHTVVISGRSESKGRRVAEEISVNGSVSYHMADSLDQPAVETMINSVIAQHGSLDILVNNAGGSSGFAPVHELTDGAWLHALQLNITTAFWAVRRCIPSMLNRQYGRIINVSSVQGKQVNRPRASHYVAAKHALNGFTKAVAFEYGKLGITCNALCVGAVETELMKSAGAMAAKASNMTYEQYRKAYEDQAMTGRLTLATDVAALAAYLASPGGGGITGAILNVDGGICQY